jgi:hypothetical protein
VTEITWTDDNVNWQMSTGPTKATIPGGNPIDVNGIPWNAMRTMHTTAVGPAFIPNFPSAAVHPSDPDIVYVAFMGRTVGSSNIDLFIARSSNGGADFDGSPAGSSVLHLTDLALGDPANTAQIIPTITIDQQGGINLIYYQAWVNPDIDITLRSGSTGPSTRGSRTSAHPPLRPS